MPQQVQDQPNVNSPNLPRSSCVCPSCGVTDLVDFFGTNRLPVHVGIFGQTREQAQSLPTGDIVLACCEACGFVHNRNFDPEKIDYKPGYEVALHHSATFRKFMEGVTARLIARFDLHNKTIVEIGCGCTYFLRMLADLGANHCIGFDPTVAKEGTENVGQGSMQLIRDYFSDRYADLQADFICCLSVFEHIPNPGKFLRMLRSMIGDRNPGIYFEVFNAFEAFRNRETWSIHYEQCNYFSRDSLAGLFKRTGFDVLAADTCYEGGEYVFVDAIPATSQQQSVAQLSQQPHGLPPEIAMFGEHHRTKVADWTGRLEEFRRLGRRVVVWGSGGKGISFLNTLNTQDVIEYVVEINPDKHGKFIPGSGQEIVPPEFLTRYQPDNVIITNALYEQEMKQQARDLGVECEFLIA